MANYLKPHWDLDLGDKEGEETVSILIEMALGRYSLALAEPTKARLSKQLFEFVRATQFQMNWTEILHASYPSRYLEIYDWIVAHHQQFTQKPVTIADFAVGQGNAVARLKEKLTSQEIQHQLFLFDFVDMSVSNLGAFRQRNLLEPPDRNFCFDVGIIGYAHHYMTIKEYIYATIYRLFECNVLFLLPYAIKSFNENPIANGGSWTAAKVLSLNDNLPQGDLPQSSSQK